MATYYPSVVVAFVIRFDESFTVSELPPGVTSQDVAANPGQSVVLSGSRDNLSQPVLVVPTAGTFELGAYRQAGKFSFSLPWKSLPIDARLFRACGVKVFLGTVTPSNFAQGMTSVGQRGVRASILQPGPDNLLLEGVVDEPTMESGDSGIELHFEGRDKVGVLIDSPLDPTLMAGLKLSEPIQKVCQQIVDVHPLLGTKAGPGRLMVSIQPDDWRDLQTGETEIPSPGDKNHLTRVRRGANGQKTQAAPAAETSTASYWDLIVNYCALVGAVPFFAQDGTIRIRPGWSLYDYEKAEANFDPRIKTPFANNQPRQAPAGEGQWVYRRMVVGRNCKKITMKRKLGGVKARAVEVVSLNTSSKEKGTGKIITGIFPDPSAKDQAHIKALRSSLTPSGSSAQTDTIKVYKPGLRSKERCKQVAQGIFEEMMRHEISGSVETNDLASFSVAEGEGGNADADLLRIRTGDPVQIIVDASPLDAGDPITHEMVLRQRQSFDEAVASVQRDVGCDVNVARAIVATERRAVPQLQRTFRVGGVKFQWSKDSGIAISFDFQNYMEPLRNQGQRVTPSTGANRTPPRMSNDKDAPEAGKTMTFTIAQAEGKE